MLRNATVVALIATVDADRALRFYQDTLGLRLVDDDAFALAFDCNGIQLRIQKVQTLRPHPFTSLGWAVSAVRREVTTLEKRGVSFERFPFLQQDDLGIWQAPSGAKIAWFKDPDGNLLSLTEYASRRSRARSGKARRAPRRRATARRAHR